jgi:hypothetical protein
MELADRFTQVFLLEIDEPTMLVRLDALASSATSRARHARPSGEGRGQ